MRISGGIFRGRVLRTAPGSVTRPTADKIREAIFNILMKDIKGAKVLDLFAGSGALGIEAVSRGAVSAVFIESGQTQVEIIKHNLESLKLDMEVMARDFVSGCRALGRSGRKFDLIFADPPYEKTCVHDVIEVVQRYDLLADKGLLIIEHKSGQVVEFDRAVLLKNRKYGRTEVSFYAKKQE
jgi:16S rRNA (guanine966-N2)-methyltransferase